MPSYEEELPQEQDYLKRVTDLARARLAAQQNVAATEKRKLMELNRQMYENTVHFSHDFDKLTEANQELGDIQTRTIHYQMMMKKLALYERMIQAPYFARIDFTEDGFEREPIYIGTGNLTDEDGLDAYVYDWRAPVASLFYRCEPGRVSYTSPSGEISGEMELKRQYEIKSGRLEYFFDSSVNIMDDVLRSVLSKNASPKMKSIVETIQREQDVIIRDLDSDLLMVQGAAGSGKTSVALHRVAFLMYQGVTGGLSANNIIILSPNALFGRYISGVLPELGEENIATKTFEEIFEDYFEGGIQLSTRNNVLERLCADGEDGRRDLLRDTVEFQLSETFCEIIERYAQLYERSLLEMPDVFYGGICIATRQALRAELLQSRINMPLAKRLRVIEEHLMERIHKEKKARLKELEQFVLEHPEHQFEVKAQARLLSIKEITSLAHKVRSFTRLNIMGIYRKLVGDHDLFRRAAGDLPLPPNLDEILDFIASGLKRNSAGYADGMALLYLRLILMGGKPSDEIKQVVIDEAQDYSPVHFRLLQRMMPAARYTVLGDVNQTIAHEADMTLYDRIRIILGKQKSTLAVMNKSFRCSAEITAFSRRFLDRELKQESFDRHGEEPRVRTAPDAKELDTLLIEDVRSCQQQEFGSLAILCKSFEAARELYRRLIEQPGLAELRLVGEQTGEIGRGLYVMPIYMAKGLEFDCAFVYGVDEAHYHTEDDRKLLYVACTRPLHRLYLYAEGEASHLLR
ncbi:AAA family ATPase [Clostridiaceae bacterium NSJ-31]|uniref:AAA family ATPase n=1 Tax=Ligaoa zhengdingensis TaxID=2763658 RepID=A0A926DZH6_9FIRM|nr:ATP-binding domain-containing protein [Ligaoa zhengdingensis]MBC8546971.1 AAA family ATPase [Ligaoa zhengdingensis]